MKYAMYQEDCNTITSDRYEQMKQSMLEGQQRKQFKEFTLRKLQFIGSSETEAIPNFYLCVKNQDDEHIYLEKKYRQNSVSYKRCTKLTRYEYEQIMRGHIGWMQNHKNELFRDFYLQATLNHLRPGFLTEYRREVMDSKKNGCVTFFKNIHRAVGSDTGLFDRPYMMFSCLDEGKILVSYKKMVNLPNMISSMLQAQEEQTEELEFVF